MFEPVIASLPTPRDHVVPANAGTHNHRRLFGKKIVNHLTKAQGRGRGNDNWMAHFQERTRREDR
jgi:hypothetical protein